MTSQESPRRDEQHPNSDHSSATGVVVVLFSRAPIEFFRFVFATSLWPSTGGQAAALTGVPASSRARASASATGEEERGLCGFSFKQQRKEGDGGDPTVLGSSVIGR